MGVSFCGIHEIGCDVPWPCLVTFRIKGTLVASSIVGKEGEDGPLDCWWTIRADVELYGRSMRNFSAECIVHTHMCGT